MRLAALALCLAGCAHAPTSGPWVVYHSIPNDLGVTPGTPTEQATADCIVSAVHDLGDPTGELDRGGFVIVVPEPFGCGAAAQAAGCRVGNQLYVLPGLGALPHELLHVSLGCGDSCHDRIAAAALIVQQRCGL